MDGKEYRFEDPVFFKILRRSLVLDWFARETGLSPFSETEEFNLYKQSSLYGSIKAFLETPDWKKNRSGNLIIHPDSINVFVAIQMLQDSPADNLVLNGEENNFQLEIRMSKKSDTEHWFRLHHGFRLLQICSRIAFASEEQKNQLKRFTGPIVWKSEYETKLPAEKQKKRPFRVAQVFAHANPHDAISRYVLFLHNLFIMNGWESVLLAGGKESDFPEPVFPANRKSLSGVDGLIYHHSIQSGINDLLQSFPHKKTMFYHNITPGRFFAPFHKETSLLLERSRASLQTLAEIFPEAWGASAYNRSELIEAGFPIVRKLPFPVEPYLWKDRPDPYTLGLLGDGKINILFTGRLSPNKRQDRLIRILQGLLKKNKNLRLCIPGGSSDPEYYSSLLTMDVDSLIKRGHLLIPGRIDQSTLIAYYQKAHLYLSLSEHEGLGVPLIEAMWFDVPVLALKFGAVEETVGIPECLMNEDSTDEQIQNKVLESLSSSRWRTNVLRKQQIRRKDFTSASLKKELESITDDFLDG